ncbi:hypothetical protein GCM10017596_07160 [Microbacterium keratanolyticum]|uniref:Serine aminopeptidase S33 domain-containing protein n=2 Tax=Microbacterium keratanolyticum TaxID=67574 RepID=A0A9W6HQE6_9MICO|nr:hypothetical protein GCM10017596_07160 [Microbacterium keratanolyticum]
MLTPTLARMTSAPGPVPSLSSGALRRETLLHDSSRSRWGGTGPRPVRAHILRPAGEGPHPVVLLSHGTGGAFDDLQWLADALVSAGFLVAGVDHHGNSTADEYLVEGFAFVWERPRDLDVLLTHLRDTEQIDPRSIGAAGFSLGGYTVAAALGARVSPTTAAGVLLGLVPTPPLPEFPDLIPELRARYPHDELLAQIVSGTGSQRIPEVRAGLLLAPAICDLLDPTSLAEIAAPVSILWGDADDNAVPSRNAHVYRDRIPGATGESVGADVGHYVFTADAADPTDVRARTASAAVAFFSAALSPGGAAH